MTCIVGVVEGNRVFVGGDSAGTDSWDGQLLVARPKVFKTGEFVIGFTDTFRLGQLLQYSFDPPKHHQDVSVDKYMATEFINAWRRCLSDGGYLRKDHDREEGGTFIVGYRGRLWVVQGGLGLCEPADGYTAVGSGYQVAFGALHATRGQDAEARVRIALEASAAHVSSVRGPFHLEVSD